MLQQEALTREGAERVARELASSKPVLLKTMVEKELGLLSVDNDAANALRGALIMGASFGLAALVPILPYLFLPVHSALYVSVALAAVMLFGMGRSRAAGRVAAGWRVDLKSLHWARSPVSRAISSVLYCPRRSEWPASRADAGRARSLQRAA